MGNKVQEMPCTMSNKPLSQADLQFVLDAVGELWRVFQGQKIFITGGTGFIGKWLLETLLFANKQLNLDCRITVLSRNPKKFAENTPHLCDPSVVTFVSGDVRNFAFPTERFKFVIHGATDVVAQTSAIDVFTSCVDGTKRVLDFARKAGAEEFLLLSSGAVYGQQPERIAAFPESYTGGPALFSTKSAYGEGKRCAEWLTNAYSEQYGFKGKIARCFAFVGPYLPLDKHFAIGNFIRDVLSDKSIIIQGDGCPYRSYLYAADLAIWLWTMLACAPSGEAYNVGSGDAVTIAELARTVSRVAGGNREVNILTPLDPAKPVERYIPDIRKAETELDLKPLISLEEAISRTLQWHRKDS